MNEIVFPGASLGELRRRLLSEAPNEAAAVMLTGQARTSRGLRMLVREWAVVPTEHYATQGPLRLLVSPAFIAPLLKRARSGGLSLVFVHTHPFSAERVWFSEIDDAGEALLMPSVFGRAPDRPHGSLVLGPTGWDARIWCSPKARPESVDRLVESGDVLTLRPRSAPENDVASIFDRNVRAFGAEGQATLRQLVVAIVGLGGTGSIVAQQLAHLGVGRFLLIDSDAIEATNLNRVVGSDPTSVGRSKVELASDMVERISGVRPRAVVGDVTSTTVSRLLLDVDLILCCTDSHGSRAVINQIAYQYMIPAIDMGVRIDAHDSQVSSISGRTQLLAPGLPCLHCHNFLDAELVRRDFMTPEERRRDPYIVGEQIAQPAVISLNGTVASMAVTMMLAATTGFPLRPRHQVLVGISGVVRAVQSAPTQNCITCSLEGSLGRGDSWPLMGRSV